MELTTDLMSEILGAIAALLYLASPFLTESRKSLIWRLMAEVLFALMFFYKGNVAGTVYYGVLAASACLEKQIEKNKWVSLVYGIAGSAAVLVLNNNGKAGVILGLSLILVFVHVDQKWLMTSGYLDVLSALALLYYSISVQAIVGIIFAVLLLIIAAAGLISSVRIARSGGMQAAAREEAEYQRKQKEQKTAVAQQTKETSVKTQSKRTAGSKGQQKKKK